MISTTAGSAHLQQEKRTKYLVPAAASNVSNLNGENATASRFADDQQTQSKFSNGIGGLFKRLSPAYRSRSKSPAAHSHHKIEKSWVTVEIKDNHHQSPSSVVGAGMGNFAPPAASSSSPSSPVLRNGGSMSPDKSPRLRGAWGNLFHRNSMKKSRDSSSAEKPSKIEARTRSEHKLDDSGEDVGVVRMASAQSTDLAGGHWKSSPRAPTTLAQRLMKETGGDIRDGMGKTAATRGTLSEEDLVSKSLSRERADVYKMIPPRGATGGTQGAIPASLTSSTAYHSQDSVFDSPTRMPSYVRISCALSGYRNYRNVDLKAAQSPRQQRTPLRSETVADTAIQATPSVQHFMPIGKSIVERRLEKFEHPSDQPPGSSTTTPKVQLSLPVEDSTNTPTPIRDLISNFNKMGIHDSGSSLANRPRQKPPPIPPKRERLLDKIEAEQISVSPMLRSVEAGLRQLSINDHPKDVGQKSSVDVAPPALEGGGHVGLHNSSPKASDFSGLASGDHVVNCEFHGKRNEEHISMTLAHQTAEAAVEEAVKFVSTSFVQSHQLQLHDGVTRNEESTSRTSWEVPAVNGSALALHGTTIVKAETLGMEDGGTRAEKNVDSVTLNGGGGGDMTRDGFYYQIEAAKERDRLEKLCVEAEADLGKEEVPEEASAQIRIAVGRVRLLLRKKLAKFEELIQKNLNPIPDDPRPTHVSDLEGYYELVKIEIDDIDGCFKAVKRLKSNQWVALEDDESKSQSNPDHRVSSTANKVRQLQVQKRSEKGSSNARAEAAKQRLKEAKEAAMQRKKQAAMESGVVPENGE